MYCTSTCTSNYTSRMGEGEREDVWEEFFFQAHHYVVYIYPVSYQSISIIQKNIYIFNGRRHNSPLSASRHPRMRKRDDKIFSCHYPSDQTPLYNRHYSRNLSFTAGPTMERPKDQSRFSRTTPIEPHSRFKSEKQQ